MPTKPKFFLLDAGPVIELHRLSIWKKVLEEAEILIPGTVCDKEVRYWDTGAGVQRPINLKHDVDAGRVHVKHATAAAMAETSALLDLATRADPGELEALTLLRQYGEGAPIFCTADHLATVILCLLSMSHLGISLESLLAQLGLGRTLDWRFSESAFRQWLADGKERLVRGEGLRGRR